MRTSDTITIHNGAVLTINSTLKCAENVCIIVKPGGKLVVSNGILKNSCIENTWRGIVVEGNSTQSQMGNNLNQGIVYLNNAIIENAICGIKVGDQSDLSKSGGIVYATNTTFKNCKNAVLFAPYRNMNNNVEFANRSKFTGCNFIVDSLYTLGIFFDTHVKLLGVNGISFKGCSFNAETYLNLSGNGYACSGISALNSGFSVNPKCYPSIASGEVCAISDVELPSVFQV